MPSYPVPQYALFAIGCFGYVTGGFINDQASTLTNDLWAYYDSTNTTCGCSVTASVNGATTICAGQNVTLTASGGQHYFWSNGSTINPIIVSPSSTTTYSVIASNACASDTTSITITVNASPSVLISGNNSLCNGDSVTLTAIGIGGAIFSWSTGATTSSITIAPTATGTYSVTLSNGLCNNTANFIVTVFQKGISSFLYKYEPCKSNCVQFMDQSTNAFNWCWSMGDGGNTSSQNPCWTYHDSAIYNPTLIINCNTNCADTFSLAVPYFISDTSSPLSTPNIFTPNEDGVNDMFAITGVSSCYSFSLKIYDRWGVPIFATDQPRDYWDGRTSAGVKVAEGTYYYILSANGENKKGFVTLVR